MRVVSNFKRLIQRYKGDPGFRKAAMESPSKRLQLLNALQINLDCFEAADLWQHFMDERHFPFKESDFENFPELMIWTAWKRGFHRHRERLKDAWICPGNPGLTAWRKRHTQRFISQIGENCGLDIFPLFAYELSKGCSMGCWFCGFSPGPLEGVFPYAGKNIRLWQDILQAGLDFGGPACKASILYHATEPFDNPDYVHFLKDFHQCCGVLAQTTTAAPLKHLSMTRQILRLRESCPTLPDRFSVHSLKILDKIHRTFTPYELRHVELILHSPGALTYKTNCGSARMQPDRLSKANQIARQYYDAKNSLDCGTIECVCGFLVNMVERSIKLISPCPATDQWPKGYRIHARGTFQDASEYRAFLQQTMEQVMVLEPKWEETLSFRNDLSYKRMENGFSLTSRAFRHSLKGKAWYADLGDLIDKGESSRRQISTRLGAKGISLVEISAMIRKIFDKGLLENG